MYKNQIDELYEKIKKCQKIIKASPQLLEDESFLFENFQYLKISYKKLPEKIRKNDLITFHYFKNFSSDEKNYKYIPKHLLDNKFFLLSCLNKNPDLFFFSPMEFRNELFSKLEVIDEHNILKYASKEILENKEYCFSAIRKHATNYMYANDSIKEALGKKFFDHHPELIEYAPPNFLTKESVLYIISSVNVNVYPHLPEHLKNDKEICEKTIARTYAFFKDFPKHIQNDENIIEYIFSNYNSSTSLFSYIHSPYTKKLKDILPYINIEYFTEDFCKIFNKEIKECILSFSKEYISHPEILKSIFKYNPEYDYFRSDFYKKVENPLIRQKISDSKSLSTAEGGQAVVKFIESLTLVEKLEKDISTNVKKININKI